jgi:iron complex transport system substrate-binding protein
MRNKTKVFFILFLLLMITISMTGCRNAKNNEKAVQDKAIKICDQMGREISIEKTPERIVSLSPSNTEILFALGLENKVVGVTNYCDHPEEAKRKEKIGNFAEPNLEKIVSLEPDLVLATSMHEKQVTQLDKLGIPTLVLEPKGMSDMLSSIELIGKATGSEDKALSLVTSLKERIDTIEEKVKDIPEDKKPLVYYELWPTPITTTGPGTFVDDLINRAGGRNIAADAKKAYPEYSQEVIIKRNPDIIIFSHHGASQQSEEDIKARKGWESVNAIKNDKVFYVNENIVQRPTPRLVDGLEAIYDIISKKSGDTK